MPYVAALTDVPCGAYGAPMPMTPEEIEQAIRDERQHYRTFVPSASDDLDASEQEVEKWLNERIGPSWIGFTAPNSGVPGVALFARFKENQQGRQVMTGLLLLADVLTAEQVRKVPVGALENSQNLTAGGAYNRMRAELAELAPLRRDDMAPEDFSRLVAQHFKVWARYVPHPAAAMAAEWNVKAPTVHTWIREARLRGDLPPARRGKST